MRTMFNTVEGSGSAARRRHLSLVSALFRVAVSTAAIGSACLQVVPASAQVRDTPVHFWAAGRVIPLATSAVWNGRDTYVPLAALPAIGAHGTLGTHRDGVTVRLRSGRTDILPFSRHNGVVMVSLTELAESANGSVLRPSPNPTIGLRPNTAYLLAHITDVHLQSNELRIVTSFPVPFVSNTLPGAIARGYIDCIGATTSRDFRPARMAAAERRAEKIRIGQFAPDIARVVVDLAPGVALERNSTDGKVTPTFMAALETGARTASVARAPKRMITDGRYDNTDVSPSTHRTRRGGQTTIPGDLENNDTPRSSSRDSRDNSRPTDREPVTKPRTATTRTADIRSISFDAMDNQDVKITIETSRKSRAYVRYSATARQVIVDIPNSRLNLDDDRQKEQDIQHPLVEGWSAATVQNSPRLPPLTRITIDAPRIVSTSVESSNDQIVLEITIPRSSRNNTAKPGIAGHALVVVDAGHGGALTGAKAHVRNRTVYEKDITLAFATRLRTALIARGARVVMTRVSDVNVPLKDRPRLANEIGANVFISIHNDSWGKANSISGTTTYYHGKSTESRRLARYVEKELAAVSGLRDRGSMSDATMYPVGFCVLRETNMPSILCEVGYLNNRSDRAKLMDTGFQQRVAEAVCTGIRNYVSGEQKTARGHYRKQAVSA